ncbi:MAG: sugar transferase, partial [Bacteroidota bacterium]
MAARYSPYIRVVQFTSDLVILNASLFAAFLYKFGSLQDPFQNLLVYFNVTWVFLVVYFKPYNLSRITTLNRVLRVQLGLIVLHLLLASVFYVLQLQSQYSRSFLFYHYAIFAGVGLTWRGVFVYLMRNYRRQGFNYRKIIIIGWGRQAEEMGKLFQQRPEYGYKLLGFFDNEAENDQVLGRLSEVRAFVEAEEVDEIYCFMPSLDHNTIKELVEFGEENLIRIKLITDFKGISYKGMEMERYGDFPVIHVMVSPLDAPSSRFLKRAFDMVFSLTVITLLLSWLVPIIGLLVKLSSRGPVFFKQQRTGKNNAQFTCYKFRTMRVNAEADSVQATRDDPRVTGIGSFLRKTSLD